jgi:hypothetical protein
MGKSGPKLTESKAAKIRKAIRKLIKENKDLQAAFNAQKKISKAQGSGAKIRSAVAKVIIRNPLLQQAVKGVFNKMK